jgi:hypothetical protein
MAKKKDWRDSDSFKQTREEILGIDEGLIILPPEPVKEKEKKIERTPKKRAKRGYELTMDQIAMLQELKYKWYPDKHFQDIVGTAIEEYYKTHK